MKRKKKDRRNSRHNRPESRSSLYNHTEDVRDFINNTSIDPELQLDIEDVPKGIQDAIKHNFNRPRSCVFCGTRTHNLGVFEPGFLDPNYPHRNQRKFLFYGFCTGCNKNIPDIIKGTLLAKMSEEIEETGTEEVSYDSKRVM